MNPDALGWFGLDDAQPASAGDGGDVAAALRLLTRVVGIVALDLGVMASLFGLALLLSLIGGVRVQAAVGRISSSPARCLAIGALVIVPLTVAVAVMWKHGFRPGRGFLAFTDIVCIAAGYAACARALGERALPERGPLAQTLIGLVALVLPLAMPIGIPVILIAAPLGLGAWLTGKKSAV